MKRGRSKPIGGETGGDSTVKAVKRSNSIGADMSALLDATINEKKAGGGGFPGETSTFAAGLSSNMVLGTPRGVISNQLPNPWDQWNDDEHGLGVGFGMGMDIQSDADILAEFGDFGDFFEDDGLGFGEVSQSIFHHECECSVLLLLVSVWYALGINAGIDTTIKDPTSTRGLSQIWLQVREEIGKF